MSVSSTKTRLVNPFPGLRPFQEGEEHFFFGREKQTDTLVDKLKHTRFLAVIGSSGSGKSSLVNCGLLNALRGGSMSGAGSTWRVACCRPAGQPIRSLANALASPDVLFNNFDSSSLALDDIIDSNLRMSSRGIVDVFEQSRQKPNANLLVIVDQFEELFRYAADDVSGFGQPDTSRIEAAEFIKLLLAAHQQTAQPIYIVLTMRSDFLGDCTQFDSLAEAINLSQYLIPRMSRDERRLAISGPVGVGGGKIDPVLLTRLVNDLGDDPDQLSILQHALNRIWVRWVTLDRLQDPLTLAHYSSIGSMKSALDLHAEKAFGELANQREQLIAERLFKALTDKATDPRGVRRPTSVAVLCELTGASIDELTSVIDKFRTPTRSFLMPPYTQTLTPDTIIDISHESLMRMWKRLIVWASEEAESTHIYQRLTTTAMLHANAQAGLWRDPDLQLALEWRAHNEPGPTWAARIGPGFEQALTFLDESRVASDQEADEANRRAEQDRELAQSKAIASEQGQRLEAQAQAARKQQQLLWLVAGGLIFTIVAAFAINSSIKESNRLEVSETQLQTAEMESNTILNTTLSLLKQNQIIKEDTPTSSEFTNSTESILLLLELNSQGYQSKPRPLLPGGSIDVKGYVNQIWLTREVPSGKLYEVGTLNESGAPITL